MGLEALHENQLSEVAHILFLPQGVDLQNCHIGHET